MKSVIASVLPAELLGTRTVYHINPTGSFEIGGPEGDAGITGRKIIVDTYGGAAPMAAAHSPARTRPRSTARPLMPRATSPRTSSPLGWRSRCTIQLAYAIGVSEPLSLYVDTHGTGTVDDARLEQAIGRIDKLGGLSPRGIRTFLGLNKPIYHPTAAYGHFGRKPDGDYFPWERLDLVEDLKAAVGVEAVRAEA